MRTYYIFILLIDLKCVFYFSITYVLMHWYSYSRQFVPRKLRFLKKCFFFFFLSFQIEDFKTSITRFLLSSILLQSSKSSSCTKFHKRQNDRKGRFTMAHFWKICKKVKNEITGTEKRRFWLIYLKTFHKSTFLGPVTSILTFLRFSQKCVSLYRRFP